MQQLQWKLLDGMPSLTLISHEKVVCNVDYSYSKTLNDNKHVNDGDHVNGGDVKVNVASVLVFLAGIPTYEEFVNHLNVLNEERKKRKYLKKYVHLFVIVDKTVDEIYVYFNALQLQFTLLSDKKFNAFRTFRLLTASQAVERRGVFVIDGFAGLRYFSTNNNNLNEFQSAIRNAFNASEGIVSFE